MTAGVVGLLAAGVGLALLSFAPSGGSARPARLRPSRPSARTGPLVAALVVAVLLVVLLGPLRGACAAAVLAPAAAAGSGVLARRSRRPAPDRSIALSLDLAAAALRGGRPVADALTLAAPAAEPATAAVLARVSGLLRLGAPADQAWGVAADGPLAGVAAVAVRSTVSGVRLASAFERAASDIRTECAATAAIRAHRAGIAAMGPLAACFLPSFVCLGIVPVVIGIARSALGVLP